MTKDEIYKYLKFSEDFSVGDWNDLIAIKFKRYFRNDDVFFSNKEVLRTEIINYIQFSEKPEYLKLFDWAFLIFKECIERDEELALKALADSFYEVSDTDLKWMTNVIIQPDSLTFSKRDKISYYFKVIDEIIEGVFKPRFKLLDKFVCYKTASIYCDNSKNDFGNLIQNFPSSESNSATLFLKDPILSISTNQWRNISAHKTFVISKNYITLNYGKANIKTINIDFKKLKQILNWVQNIYRVIRLAEVFIYLNYTEQIVNILGGTSKMNLRFESSLMHLIHNLQVVGFQFIATEELNNIFVLKLKMKANDDLKSSIIHASQCLDQLSSAVFDDEFTRDKYNKVRVEMVDDLTEKCASASVEINIAMKKVKNEMILDDYIQNIDFKINNFA